MWIPWRVLSICGRTPVRRGVSRHDRGSCDARCGIYCIALYGVGMCCGAARSAMIPLLSVGQ